MRSAFAVFLRGFTLPFGATSGRRLVFDGVDGHISVFDSAGEERIRIGGTGSESRILLETGDVDQGESGYLSTTIAGAAALKRYFTVLISPSSDGSPSNAAQLSLRSENEGGTILPGATLEDGNGGDLEEVILRSQRLRLGDGANRVTGTAVLVAGTVVVNNSRVLATSRIQLTSQVDGGTPGFLRVTARVAGTSFTITSSNAADTSTVAWLLTNPA